ATWAPTAWGASATPRPASVSPTVSTGSRTLARQIPTAAALAPSSARTAATASCTRTARAATATPPATACLERARRGPITLKGASERVRGLDVEVLHLEGVRLDEVAAGLDL